MPAFERDNAVAEDEIIFGGVVIATVIESVVMSGTLLIEGNSGLYIDLIPNLPYNFYLI